MAAEPDTRGSTSRIGAMCRKAARSPFLQFLVLGGLIFLGAHVVDGWRDRRATKIVVDRNAVHRIAALYQAQNGAPPSPAQLDHLIDAYIHDEILFREAKRINLDDGDEIVRRRLIQKIEFLTARADPSSAPTEEALRHYYDSHKDRFTRPARVDFTHLFFSPDEAGQAAAETRARQALARLQADPAMVDRLGDPFPLQSTFVGMTKTDAVQLFGDASIVDGLFQAPVGIWSGPFRSGYGWHLIRVTASEPAKARPFEDVRSDVAAALSQEMQDRAAADAFEAMKARYKIVRPVKP